MSSFQVLFEHSTSPWVVGVCGLPCFNCILFSSANFCPVSFLNSLPLSQSICFGYPICVAVHLQSYQYFSGLFRMQLVSTDNLSVVIINTDMTNVWGSKQLHAQFLKPVRCIARRLRKTSLCSGLLTGFTLSVTDFCSEWSLHKPTNINDLDS